MYHLAALSRSLVCGSPFEENVQYLLVFMTLLFGYGGSVFSLLFSFLMICAPLARAYSIE